MMARTAGMVLAVTPLVVSACATEIDTGDQDDLDELETVGPNLLDNNDFEEPVIDFRCSNGNPLGCNRSINWGLHGAKAIWIEGGRDSGTNAVSLDDTFVEGSRDFTYATQRVPITDGLTYRFRVWGLPPDGSVSFDDLKDNLWVLFKTPAGWRRPAGWHSLAPITRDWWSMVRINVSPPPGATAAAVIIYGDLRDGPIEWDDALFAPLN